MSREDRQDIGKLVKIPRIAGSDLPKRGDGVRDVDTSKRKPEVSAKLAKPAKHPAGYKGEHRDRG